MNHEIFDDPRSHEADDLSLRAELAERRGELAAAQGLYRQAAALEEALARAAPASSPRVRAVLALSAASLWAAGGALMPAISVCDAFLADVALPLAERGDLQALVDQLRVRAAQEAHYEELAELMASWLRREPSGPDFDPDAIERVRIESI
jgi:hypothetical protein